MAHKISNEIRRASLPAHRGGMDSNEMRLFLEHLAECDLCSGCYRIERQRLYEPALHQAEYRALLKS